MTVLGRCRRCGHVLINPQTAKKKIGPECEKRGDTRRSLTLDALEAIVRDDAQGDGLQAYAQRILDRMETGKRLKETQRRYIATLLPPEDAAPRLVA
jgi:hypothetical protein